MIQVSVNIKASPRFTIIVMFAAASDYPLQPIAQRISASSGVNTRIVAQTDSTNQALLDTPSDMRSSAPIALIALHQTAGRGRMGRVWQSANSLNTASGDNTAPQPQFLASVAALSDLGLAELSALPLCIGMALAQCLREMGCELGVKWPNDLMHVQQDTLAFQAAKLGGILVETRLDPSTQQVWVVMGVGINWHGAPKLADRDTSSVLDLLQAAQKALPDSEWACAQFLLAIKSAWDRVQRGESVSPTEFQRYDLLQGRTVNTVALGTNQSLSGIACGINAAGALGIQVIAPDSKPSNDNTSTARTHWVNSGEVRVSVNPSVSP